MITPFPKPDADTFRGPEWDDAKLMAWVTYYQRTRAESLETANDRTDGTVAYCTYRMDGMLAELARRKSLAKRFKTDPRGPWRGVVNAGIWSTLPRNSRRAGRLIAS